MKKVRINSSERMITIGDILSFEKTFNIVIPSSLKRLYLKYNGGEVEFSDASTYDFASIKYGELTLGGLVQNLIIDENVIPGNFLPFAVTGVGHMITIQMDSAVNNKIYLFRYDELEPILLANSLEELLGVTSIDEL